MALLIPAEEDPSPARGRPWKQIFQVVGRVVFALAILSFPVPSGGNAVGDEPSEYQVKAAFLFNFAKFIVWPADMARGPICIGVVGEDPFGSLLDEAVKGKTANGRDFVVKHSLPEQEIKACQIVFISTSEKKRLRSILDGLKGASALTVGEMEKFSQSGGMIRLEMLDNKVRFSINVDAVERARLTVSARLLSLATVIREGGH